MFPRIIEFYFLFFRSIKPLRVQQLLLRLLGMAITSKATIKVISNSLLRLLHMEILLQHMANQVILSKGMPSLFTVDTRMLSLLRVISKRLGSKVMLVMDNPKLGMPLQLAMGLLQQLLVATITTQLRLEAFLLFQLASLQQYQLLKAEEALVSFVVLVT